MTDSSMTDSSIANLMDSFVNLIVRSLASLYVYKMILILEIIVVVIVLICFISLEPSWLQSGMPNKSKKRKLSPKVKRNTKGRGRRKSSNYSIKPPKDNGPKGQDGELKFNYKTLRFERTSTSEKKTNENDNKESTHRLDYNYCCCCCC